MQGERFELIRILLIITDLYITTKINSMRQPKEFGIIKQFLNEMKDVKRRLMRVEHMLSEDQLSPKDWNEIRKTREEIRKGKYVTLEQLKKELLSK